MKRIRKLSLRCYRGIRKRINKRQQFLSILRCHGVCGYGAADAGEHGLHICSASVMEKGGPHANIAQAADLKAMLVINAKIVRISQSKRRSGIGSKKEGRTVATGADGPGDRDQTAQPAASLTPPTPAHPGRPPTRCTPTD